jgi:hypothetical protein
MRRVIFRYLVFAVLLVLLVIMNMMVFRSPFPVFWVPTGILTGVLLIYFPYETFFKKKE